ncbi:MAG TPA: acetate--CoA ligase family protein [Thermosynergistes sp.]|nr:acetate--CoA ligase family protein [Thermosynergistes sp.]
MKAKDLLLSCMPLAEHQVKELVQSYGVPVPQRLVLEGDEGLPRRLPFPYPVVVKISDPQILHKSEVGGVRLGIKNRAQLERAVSRMRQDFPGKAILIEVQEPLGVEAIVGLIYDSAFGPSIMLGMGGILTEVYQDTAFRTVPIDESDAYEMISLLRGARLFEGFRNIRANKSALVSAMLAVSRLGEELGEHIAQMDLNPVIVYEDRCVAVDAKLLLRKRDSAPPLGGR